MGSHQIALPLQEQNGRRFSKTATMQTMRHQPQTCASHVSFWDTRLPRAMPIPLRKCRAQAAHTTAPDVQRVVSRFVDRPIDRTSHLRGAHAQRVRRTSLPLRPDRVENFRKPRAALGHLLALDEVGEPEIRGVTVKRHVPWPRPLLNGRPDGAFDALPCPFRR